MDLFSILLVAACIVLLFLRPEWDPAIRLKEWNNSVAEKLSKRK